MSADPQVRASDPAASAFVEANAGSGKTSTLVKRVARLLLAGARPEAILCVGFNDLLRFSAIGGHGPDLAPQGEAAVKIQSANAAHADSVSDESDARAVR